MNNIAKKGLTKKKVQNQKLIMEMKILDQVQKIFKKLSNNLTEKILSLKNLTKDKNQMMEIFEEIQNLVGKDVDEYKIQSLSSNNSVMKDDEKIEIGVNVLNIDKYLISYKQFIKNETKFTQKDMIRVYEDINDDDLFVMERNLLSLQFYHDFAQYTNNIQNKLYSDIQRRRKKITQELGTSEMMKDYVKSRISNLLTEKVGEINIKPIADEIKKMSEEIRDLIPRTKSEHVGISMHKIRGGNQNRILWKNMFNKYNRNDLNLISKHYGLKNIEKVKNKRTIINNLNAIILYRSGKFNKRKELNSFSKLFGINPKLYKRKKDLIHKLNQTIS